MASDDTEETAEASSETFTSCFHDTHLALTGTLLFNLPYLLS